MINLQRAIDVARPNNGSVEIPPTEAWYPGVLIERDLHLHGPYGSSPWWGLARVRSVWVGKGRVYLSWLATNDLWWRSGYQGAVEHVGVLNGVFSLRPPPGTPLDALPSNVALRGLHVSRSQFYLEASDIRFDGGSIERTHAAGQREVEVSCGRDPNQGPIRFRDVRIENDDTVTWNVRGPGSVTFDGCILTHVHVVIHRDHPPGPVVLPNCTLTPSRHTGKVTSRVTDLRPIWRR